MYERLRRLRLAKAHQALIDIVPLFRIIRSSPATAGSAVQRSLPVAVRLRCGRPTLQQEAHHSNLSTECCRVQRCVSIRECV